MNETMSPERLRTFFCSVCSAVWPCFWIWTLMPVVVEPALELARSWLAWLTRCGTSCWKLRDLGGDRVGEQQPDPDQRREHARYTARIASPRGTCARSSIRTSGLSISATTTRRSGSAAPARPPAPAPTAPSSASGSSTSWTQRGTTHRRRPAAAIGARRRSPARRCAVGHSVAVRLGRLPSRPSSSPPSCCAPCSGGETGSPRVRLGSLGLIHLEVCASRGCPTRPASCSSATSSAASAGARCCAAARPARAPRARLRRRQRRERRRRARDHPEDRRRAVRRRRRRDHARQPHLPPPRDLPVPRRAASGSCGRPTSCAASPATAGAWSRATACGSGVVSLSGNLFMNAGRAGVRRGRRGAARAARQGRPRARRHARRGDEREGRDGLAPRRPRDRRRRHPHPRPDRRRPRAARAAPPTSPTSA